MDADRRDRTAQQFPDPGVALHLRGRRQDAVHATLEQHVEVTLGVGTLPVDAADQNPMALTTRLALGADHETRELCVAQVAGHDAYGAGAPGNQASCQGVGDVFQGLRGVEDALPGLRGDGPLAVEHLAGGLEADPGLRGHVPQRRVCQDRLLSGLALQTRTGDTLDKLPLEEQEDDYEG